MMNTHFFEEGTILQKIIAGYFDTYALVYRPDKFKKATVEVLVGTECILKNLKELDQLQSEQRVMGNWGVLLVTPYRQIKERGFTVIDDNTPFRALAVNQYETCLLEDAIDILPEVLVDISNTYFNPNDENYEKIVKEIIENEIGTGEGANFVIKRTLNGDMTHYDDHVGMTIFRNLLEQEKGAYWTFFIHMKEITLVGASPEMHISLNAKSVSMMPISGTYRFPASGQTKEGLFNFLQDTKEEGELSMVLDEELKMMTNICSSDVKVQGPSLINMSKLAHVYYNLKGSTELPVSEILRLSMFAPTVVGSPLENATRVIARYEKHGRSYYSGFTALIENVNNKSWLLDSAILIRTAEISKGGKIQVGVGATLVRDSNPLSEVQETIAKASAIQNAMGMIVSDTISIKKEDINRILKKRNERLSSFWFGDMVQSSSHSLNDISKPEIIILDNEDTFTSMMAYQLREVGFKVDVKSFSSISDIESSKLLVVGPGPGDPCNLADPRVLTSRHIIMNAMVQNQPFISICFGHQILCALLELPIERLSPPNQGIQKKISIFGKTEYVGFYNTFTAISESECITNPVGDILVYRDPLSKHVHGLKGKNFCSMQFHPESILTKDGHRILKDAIYSVMAHKDRAVFEWT
ncbi:phenazine-specific anthranilate synthase [Xenorhabdus sp. Flor]|uniref:anthranilate synthase family protein n=1 Tax=Xenorhabdus cabanillasii TaxID=351673 RepID=UPI001998182D|nr:anthranilate synthase family protein [Xenorhabdus sp. Flor]MBD2816629.1 phenazine-specific anthranilate synthase [Xenorhabdus sp. Flor]